MTSIASWPAKDPQDSADFQIDWSTTLGTDQILTSVWSLPVGSGLTTSSNTFTTNKTTIWLAGGNLGTHRIKNTITTNGGRIFERSVSLSVEQL